MKKILLITVLIVFGLSSVENAEGAWVLWERKCFDIKQLRLNDRPPGKSTMMPCVEKQWEPIKASTSLKQCEEEQMKICESYIFGKEGRGVCPDWAAVIFRAAQPSEFDPKYDTGQLEWKCLPDTIDPRK